MSRPALFLLLLVPFAACRHAHPPAGLPSALSDRPAMETIPWRAPGAGGSAAARDAAPAPAVAAGPEGPAAAPGGAAAPAAYAAAVIGAMDTKTDPCVDFYRYACGGWLATTKLPADKSVWGRGFSDIYERNQKAMRAILEEPAGEAADPDGDRIRRYYQACMDEPAIEEAGVAPLQSWLERISAVSDLPGLLRLSGELHLESVPVLFASYVEADAKNPDTYLAVLTQGGLALPDRDYYLKDDPESRKLRADYRAHVGRMLRLSGMTRPAAAWASQAILAFETELARHAWPKADLRDPDKVYNKLDLDGLKELTPGIDWGAFLAGLGYPAIRDINVGVPPYLKGLQEVLGRTELDVLRPYLRWHLVHQRAGDLSQAFVDEDFAFFGRRLSGRKELAPRWKRCVDSTDAALGEALGKVFVERHFAGDSKALALEMIAGIEHAFAQALPELAWMDGATRERALEKMRALTNKIGYPDRWRDYSALAIDGSGHFAHATAARRFESDRLLRRVGGKVDRLEWFMTPPTVNAYYNPLVNEMVFPAGILQAPFFDQDFPAAMNYGGIGMVMGHELTHGYDDEGRKFDASGRLREWWEPAVSERFEQAARCVDDLYSGYEVQPGVKVNGKLTLGENIADLGGIKEAFRAYRNWQEEHGEEKSAVPGLSPEQLFFVGFAQTWCTLATPEIEKVLATVDPHSPPRFRVNGPLQNFPAFAEVFGCAAGSPMRRAAPCAVW